MVYLVFIGDVRMAREICIAMSINKVMAIPKNTIPVVVDSRCPHPATWRLMHFHPEPILDRLHPIPP
jgi:hypothetical protein